MHSRRTGLVTVILLLLAASSCGGSSTSDADIGAIDGNRSDGLRDASETACGASTCAGDQYCFIECLCCGFPTVDGGPQPSARTECRPIPAGCSTSDLCTCAEITSGGGVCDPSRRVVELPCA